MERDRNSVRDTEPETGTDSQPRTLNLEAEPRLHATEKQGGDFRILKSKLETKRPKPLSNIPTPGPLAKAPLNGEEVQRLAKSALPIRHL